MLLILFSQALSVLQFLYLKSSLSVDRRRLFHFPSGNNTSRGAEDIQVQFASQLQNRLSSRYSG